MTRARIREIIRQFPQNSMKLLLEDARNVRDLLGLSGGDEVALIDYDHLRLDPTTYVARDYRHVESDVVLRAPLRGQRSRRVWEALTIYILIEHQSEPEPLMPLRVLEYVVQIYKAQLRDWARRHASFAGLRLQPVLPVVFYTGTRRWDSVGRLVDLVALGERFERVLPGLEPLFINLPALPGEQLESAGGYFGWVLRLVQQRQRPAREFQGVLQRVVQHLQAMPAGERLRWQELLSYVHALVYHERDAVEQQSLQAILEASMLANERRQEVLIMRKTIADVLKEEGRKQGRKEGEVRTLRRMLLQLLQQRFGDVPKEIAETIQATKDLEQLNTWGARVVTAPTLKAMQIHPADA